MILILKPHVEIDGREFQRVQNYLNNFKDVSLRVHKVEGAAQTITEVYLIGNTSSLSIEEMRSFPGIDHVVRVSEEYRILGRHKDDNRSTGFTYNGVSFSQDNLNILAGLCAVDSPESVESMMKGLKENGQVCTRMGAYKPRTSPYSFQGYGCECLPYVFELAGKYGIKVIAMEITHDSQLDEIQEALEKTGKPTGVMLQIGTRNTQNFELLKKVGRQHEFPILFKRGFGITLDESLHAAEYLASEGNQKVIFALRGMKTNIGDPHRNMVDFAHIPVVKRLTRMPVCVDPSHSVGSRHRSSDQMLDITHVTAQGIIAGANMVLIDFHPNPKAALVDGPQAMRMEELSRFLDDVRVVREAYEKRAKIWNEPIQA